MKNANDLEGKETKADGQLEKEKKDEAEEDHASHQHDDSGWSRDVTIPPT